MADEIITDEEWQNYLDDEFHDVTYCLPKKEDVERFLKWREKKA